MRNGTVSFVCACGSYTLETVSGLIIGFFVRAEDIAGKQKCTPQSYGANKDSALLSNK